MNSLGICVGATTISLVGLKLLADGSWRKEFGYVFPHHGNPRVALIEKMRMLSLSLYDRVAVTGRKFRHYIDLPSISEAEAVEMALKQLNGRLPAVDAVVSAGGETFMVYVVGQEGRISSVKTGNKCASGTGEFFLQQLRRIGLTVEEAVRMAKEEKPYRVSGRCSVFCKSDCTHATNKGVPKGRIVAGLCEMMAGKIMEILRPLSPHRVMVIGGMAQNEVVMGLLRREVKELIVPEEAPYFEALGAAFWAAKASHGEKPRKVATDPEKLIRAGKSSFNFHPPLKETAHLVEFRSLERGTPQRGDRCLLGLDVGSTTTKAVIVRTGDHRIVASVYLRTEGNPVRAARLCYERLIDELGPLAEDIHLIALGVTGSGRQIAGLHAMTQGIVNEIVAHARAAIFFDPTVDTIFEIGGQDAKYTFIRDGMPADYAMNDACSAGTGSFLEEAARESMGVAMEEIGALALQANKPPNFNDQCAAFISSDIKTATHEGISREDILAGLVYSVCLNYINRVKGNRAVGENIFMQGGVCYNKAVPLAMASLTGKKIVVPPEPGLMGAFGVALEVERWLAMGLLKESKFSLKALRERELDYKEPFFCDGGKEGCDRRCEIARIVIDGKIYPFGGACNRWYNVRNRIQIEAGRGDLVRKREEIVFRRPRVSQSGEQKIGLNRSFLVNTYFPLYAHFFSALGFDVVIPDEVDERGCDLKRAPFCYPAELAHGFFGRLLKMGVDFIFLPQVKGIEVEGDTHESNACPLCQGEPYYLRSAFKEDELLVSYLKKGRLLTPILNFSRGLEAMEEVFLDVGKYLGKKESKIREAYREAIRVQREAMAEVKEEGHRLLNNLSSHPSSFAVVIFGRPYNAFVSEAHKGIPHKFASRGIPVLTLDALPIEDEEAPKTMYWSAGRKILKAAQFVSRHPSLFACYITNFSCGPDSFILTYFARRMKGKPFLVLELDSHVADAGLETRIEAFLDIVRNYRELEKRRANEVRPRSEKRRAYFDYERQVVVDSRGRAYPLTHPRVHLVMPPMGSLVNVIGTAIFRSKGIRATPLPRADEGVLKLGRGHTSCKECLPLLLTVGSLLNYLKERKDQDELLVYFMPTAGGPCRFGQYSPFTEELLDSLGIEDVAIYSIHAEDGYMRHLDNDFTLALWSGVVINDILQDIYSLLYTCAHQRDEAMEIYHREVEGLIRVFETEPRYEALSIALRSGLEQLSQIPLQGSLRDTPAVLLSGEIYVRHDDLSRRHLVELLGEEGFVCKVSSILEWVYYTDYCYRKGLSPLRPKGKDWWKILMRAFWMRRYERLYKSIAASYGLMPYRLEKIRQVVSTGGRFLHPALTGEAILTVGAAMAEVPTEYCGAIAIGPFGCMPNRLAESILSVEMGNDRPFLAIETDGNPFPQMISARLEIFVLQARRVFEEMRRRKSPPSHEG
ncbi:MAG TPA: acyl-CoA dehydratase activase [Syntrophales bacterium]|nr:acyl-CoA dehydratase activase [Syntrophales bacterium]HOL59457.1 acyl-CoA dehydratase activase [Syntrophales bacterium]HPO34639.1 acyl-CoA dehydratase activase [Syntrophales bacterium]